MVPQPSAARPHSPLMRNSPASWFGSSDRTPPAISPCCWSFVTRSNKDSQAMSASPTANSSELLTRFESALAELEPLVPHDQIADANAAAHLRRWLDGAGAPL